MILVNIWKMPLLETRNKTFDTFKNPKLTIFRYSAIKWTTMPCSQFSIFFSKRINSVVHIYFNNSNRLTLPLDQPVMSSGTPSLSKSKLWMTIAWFLDCTKRKLIMNTCSGEAWLLPIYCLVTFWSHSRQVKSKKATLISNRIGR